MFGTLIALILLGAFAYFVWKRIKTSRAEREARRGTGTGFGGGNRSDRDDSQIP